MKVIFDNSVPRPLRAYLPGHEIATAFSMGWATLENGDLLTAAEAKFDAMITSDKNLRYQQNLTGLRLALIILPTNFLPDVMKLAPKVHAALAVIEPGSWVEIEL